MAQTLGDRIRQARELRGLTQTELAVQVGSGRAATVSDWEGNLKQPGADSLAAMVAALRVSGHWLLTGEGSMELLPPGAAEEQLAKIARLLRTGETGED